MENKISSRGIYFCTSIGWSVGAGLSMCFESNVDTCSGETDVQLMKNEMLGFK